MRSIFAGLQYRWSGGLSQAQRDAWDAYADGLGEQTGGCDPRPRTGKDFFLGWNLEQLNADAVGLVSAGVRDDGPAAAGRPPAVSGLTTLEEGGPGLLWGGSLAGASPAIGRVLFYVYRPLPVDVRYVGNPWHLAATAGLTLGGTGFSSASQFDPPSNWAADWRLSTGDRVRWKLRAVYDDGRYGFALRGLSVVG